MAVTRTFLGWDRPLCTTVPDHLLNAADSRLLDLRDTVVVVPTRQSSWRLRAALPLQADERARVVLGPEILTPPLLISPPRQAGLATPADTLLAWVRVLTTRPPDACNAFLGTRSRTPEWSLQVARRLQTLREDLADGGLTISAVARHEGAQEEAERWGDMAGLETAFHQQLDAWGLVDACAARLSHAQTQPPPRGVSRIILAAVPDPPQLLLTALDRWARDGCAVDILIAAPADEAAAFDAWGRPLPDAWETRPIPLREEDLWLQANPGDTAVRIARTLQTALEHAPGDSAHPHVAIGAPDRETIAPLERELAAAGLKAFDPQNRPFSRTPLHRLVDGLLALRKNADYETVATLLRHPDVLFCLGQPAEQLRALDTFQSAYLPVSLDDFPAVPAAGDADLARLAKAADAIRHWRATLRQSPATAALRAILQDIYARRQLDPDNSRDTECLQSITAFDAVLREMEGAERAGRADADAGDVLLARLHDTTIPADRGDAAINLEGWLELAWNPAPLLFVAGMNEGCVPDGRLGDAFLPDALRRQLGLRDDSLRIARDAYVLRALLEQRRTDGRVILALHKTASAGDPLRPSRLLFRCPDAALVQRARRLFHNPPPACETAPFSLSFTLNPNQVPPTCIKTRRATEISPTLFRAYLTCPLRFYLQHVLDMTPLDDRSREPDARTFGNWVHETLDAMAQAGENVWGCDEVNTLERFLLATLDEQLNARFGRHRWLGIELARDSAIQRLKAFAVRQVAWHRAGWTILACESTRTCTINGLLVKGRIDRIDQNSRTGEIAVLDYKTTDSHTLPDAAHVGPAQKQDPIPEARIPAECLGSRGDKRWIDLQLPIYREFVRHAFPDTPIHLGYILLPKDLKQTQFATWTSYSDALQTSAMHCAHAIAGKIKAGEFWPPGRLNSGWEDDFAGLLLGDPERTLVPPESPWRRLP